MLKTNTKYERPKNNQYPIIYTTFMARAVNSDLLVEYHIQDLTEDHINNAFELIRTHLMPEEVFQKAARLTEKEEYVDGLRCLYNKVFEQRFSVACFVSGSNLLVGLNAIAVKNKGIEDTIEPDIKEIKELISAVKYVTNKFDIFEYFNVDHYLYGVGLCVHKDYRGRGVATEILKARAPLLRCLNLTVTSTIFTTIGSQKAAKIAGYEEKSSTSYEELSSKFTELNFSHTDTSDCKILTLKIV